LGPEVRTITLIASPGVGPIRHATEFGIGDYLYWAYVATGAAVPVRSESLANFGRIAAGHAHRVDLDQHRTLVGDRRAGELEPSIPWLGGRCGLSMYARDAQPVRTRPGTPASAVISPGSR
jgi:hypothetical protein